MLTVACVYAPGGGFIADYVHRLQAGVGQFCRRPHRFVCLTNEKIEGVECVALRRGWQGYWNKLELFQHRFPGPVAYFDLDTMLCRDISDMMETDYPFASLTHWQYPDVMASAVMLWDGRLDFSYIPKAYNPAINQEYRRHWRKNGDQAFIQERIGAFGDLNELFPGRIVSYKMHVRTAGTVPPDASIVCFHGKPRPHQINWQLEKVA